MEINKKLRAQLEEILREKQFGLTFEELAQEFEKAGRSAPCLHFSALARNRIALGGHCKLDYELDCLNCSDYEPHEQPGSVESAACVFSWGKVRHIMAFAESDGFYRWGETLCGRLVDEEVDDLEILDSEGASGLRLCKKCAAKT